MTARVEQDGNYVEIGSLEGKGRIFYDLSGDLLIIMADDGSNVLQDVLTLDGTAGMAIKVGGLVIDTGGLTVTLGGITLNGGDLVVANANGVIVGHTAQITVSDGDGSTNVVAEVQVLGTAKADASLVLASFNTTDGSSVAPMLALVKSGNGTIASAATAVADNEVVGEIVAFGADGTDMETPVARISFVVDDPGVPGTGAIGGSLEFYTTADGGETLTLAVTIDTNQNLIVNNGNGLLVGNATGVTAGALSEFQVLGTALADGSAVLGLFAASALAPDFQFVKGRGATIGSLTIVNDNDEVGRVVWLPADGADLATEAAVFQAEVDDASPAAGDIGMAFVWESMAGGGAAIAERMRLSAAGDLSIANGAGIIVGNATQVTTSAVGELQVLGTAAADSIVTVGRWSADANGPEMALVKSRNPTIGSSTVVVASDVLGSVVWYGDDSGDFATPAASIRAIVDGTPGSNDMPGSLILATTADGANTVTDRVTIAATGGFTVAACTTVPSIGTSPGDSAGTQHQMTGGVGGATSIATTGTGGNGGHIALTAGAGGQATAATTAATGGNGGQITLTTGAGAAEAVVGAGNGTGGNGGALNLTAGGGGAVTTSTGTNQGGVGGAINLTSGNGGAAQDGTDTGGASGAILIRTGSGGNGDTGGGSGAITLRTGAVGTGGSPTAGIIAFEIAATEWGRFTAAGVFRLGVAGSRLGKLQLDGNTSGSVTIQTTADPTTWTWTLPPNDGEAGDVMVTDGAGASSWVSGVRSVDVQLTNAQLLALLGTDITLVAAPGANRAIVVHGIYLFFDVTTTAYTINAGATSIGYASDGVDVAVITEAGFLDTVADAGRWYLMGGAAATPAILTPVANAAIVIRKATADMTGGNAANTLSIRVYYSVVDTVAFT